MEPESNIAGYEYFYLKDNRLKSKLIPTNLKDLILEKFGDAIIHIDEETLNNFIKENE